MITAAGRRRRARRLSDSGVGFLSAVLLLQLVYVEPDWDAGFLIVPALSTVAFALLGYKKPRARIFAAAGAITCAAALLLVIEFLLSPGLFPEEERERRTNPVTSTGTFEHFAATSV